MKQGKNYWHNRQVTGRKFYVGLLIASLLFATGCRKVIMPDTTNSGDAPLSLSPSNTAQPPAIVVNTGGSIQAAVNAAAEGSVIKINPGTYVGSITINKSGITLMGEGNVTIQNPGGAAIGVIVQDAADGFTLRNVTVRDFKERGVELKHVDGFLLSHVTAITNGEFGLFVQDSNNGTIEHCDATGHTDTGIFVGESTHVTVSQNKSYGNTIGFETENASFVTIDNNQAYDNAAGMLCLLVPGKPATESSNISITRNQIRGNNHSNLQTVEGELEKVLPSGIGVLLLGTNHTLVQDNHVTDNQFTGVAVLSTLALAVLANIPPEAFAGNDFNPDEVKVISNQVKNNGFAAPAGYPPAYRPFLGFDLLWDGSGTGNCWIRNLYGLSFPSPLPAC